MIAVVTMACVVVGTGTGELVFSSGESATELEDGKGLVVTGTSGTGLVVSGTSGTGLVVAGLSGAVDVSGVATGGGTHWVQTVEVLVTKTVEIDEVVSTDVTSPLVTVFVTGHVVSVV